MRSLKKRLIILGTVSLCGLFPVICFAQDVQALSGDNDAVPLQTESQVISDLCYSLDDNAQWKELFSRFSSAYQDKDYERALSYMRDLQQICDRSPILNYSIGMTYREMGNYPEALTYYRRATGNKEFNIPIEMQQKFWYAQYEVENAAVICAQSDLDACESEKQGYIEQLNSLQNQMTQNQAVYEGNVEAFNKRDKVVMWTGAGLGIAGLGMLAGGAALLAVNQDGVDGISKKTVDKDKEYTVKVKSGYRGGWALLGTGIGITVVGAVMAGIGGYNYTHPVTEGVTASLGISPNSIDLGLTF